MAPAIYNPQNTFLTHNMIYNTSIFICTLNVVLSRILVQLINQFFSYTSAAETATFTSESGPSEEGKDGTACPTRIQAVRNWTYFDLSSMIMFCVLIWEPHWFLQLLETINFSSYTFLTLSGPTVLLCVFCDLVSRLGGLFHLCLLGRCPARHDTTFLTCYFCLKAGRF